MKHIVITGAARGFGREIALHAHRLGYRVMASVRSFDSAAKSLQEAGITCELLEMNNTSSIDAFAESVKQWCSGNLFALVNNAGVSYPAPMELVTHEDLVAQFQVNVFGHIQLTQRLLPVLRNNKGRIVMISSQSAIVSSPMVGAYSASKRALEALTEALVMEIGSDVQICMVRPGPYATSIWDSSIALGQRYNFDDTGYKPLALAIQALATSRPMKPASELADRVMRILGSAEMRFIYGAPFSSQVMMAIRRLLPSRWFFKIASLIISKKKREIENEANKTGVAKYI